MKKSAGSLILFFSLMAMISCAKKIPEEMPAETPEPEETFQKATILADKIQLSLYGRDGKMHGIKSLTKSNTIEILYTKDKIETKEIDGTVYLPAVYDSCDYWIEGTKLAINSIPAVIIEKTTPYEDKDLQNSAGQKPIRFGTTVALSMQEDHITENAQLIYFLDPEEKKLKTAWIRKETVSSREDDIVVMQVVEGLKVTKRATPRNELFKKAAKYTPCAKVAAALNAEKVELVENSYQEVLNALPGARIKVNVPELLTVDQTKDPFKK